MFPTIFLYSKYLDPKQCYIYWIHFSDSLVNLKIDGYDNDDIKFPYNYRVLTREFEIDFSILDEKLNNLTLRMSKYITYNTIRLDWDYFVEDMKLNYSVILSRVE